MTACVHTPRFDPLGATDPLDALSRLERLRWRRRQRAVVADHERFMAETLRDLAASATPVTAFTSVAASASVASVASVAAFTSVASVASPSPSPTGVAPSGYASAVAASGDASGVSAGGYASAVAAGVVDLRLAGWRICLGGLSRPAVDALGGRRNWRMSGAGRYGPRWWVRIEPAPDPQAPDPSTPLDPQASDPDAARAAAGQGPRPAGRGPTNHAGSVTLLATHLVLAPTWPGPGPGRDQLRAPSGPRLALLTS